MATTTATTTFEIRPIEPSVCRALLDVDDAGRRPEIIVDTDGGSPLRCCLRLSAPGEAIALASYSPLRRWAVETGASPGAYEEVGPVFIHAEPCDGPVTSAFPVGLFESRRVFRRYSAGGSILGGRLVEPPESAGAVLDEIFAASSEVALVHVRAVEFGCFLLEVRRVTAGRRP
jgi:hypothetical protein